MSRPDLREQSAWAVRIPAHSIPRTTIGGEPAGGEYEVPERASLRFEASRRSALAQAVRDAHMDAGIPPWLPYLRRTARLAEVRATTWTPLGEAGP